ARGGGGCTIDVSQIESGVYFLSPQMAQVSRDGIIADRRGNASLQYAPHGVYRANDGGFIAISAMSNEQWQALAGCIGRADFTKRGDRDTAEGRISSETELDEAITMWTSQYSALEAEQILQANGVAAHRAQGPAEYSDDDQIQHRSHLVELAHPIHETTVVEGARVKLSSTPGGPKAPAPILGEHTIDVLEEQLGYTTEQIKALDVKGVLS